MGKEKINPYILVHAAAFFIALSEKLITTHT